MKKFENIKSLLYKYRHGAILLYGFIYLIWFTALEKAITTDYNVVYSRLDDLIPFNEIFIIPYMLWFLYILVTIGYFFLTSKKEYYKYCGNLFIGMTICLIIYTIWPNGQNLRVDLDTLGRSNIFTKMLAPIYKADTPTNVLPSIHTFNSIAAHIAIHKNKKLRDIRWLQRTSLILAVLICISTVALKQHSILDVFAALALNIVMYALVYIPSWDFIFQDIKKAKTKTAY